MIRVMDDTDFENEDQDGSREETSRRHAPEDGGVPGDAAGDTGSAGGTPREGILREGTCPGISSPQGSQIANPPPVFSIDWLEIGGCIEWGETSDQDLVRFRDRLKEAQKTRSPLVVMINKREWLLRESGIGSGRQSHMEFCLTFDSLMVAFSARSNTSRRHSNFYAKMTGESCLFLGYKNCLKLIQELIKHFGGSFSDRWVKRIDFCLDLPGVSLQETFLPALKNGQFLTSFADWGNFSGKGGDTGFAAGDRKGVRLVIYDKLKEIRRKNSDLVLNRMKETRWGGTVPERALRIEYLVNGTWLRARGLTSLEQMLDRRPDIVHKLTQYERHPMFVMTDAVPDRENKHQSRVGVLPEWKEVVERFQRHAGDPQRPLEIIRNDQMNWEWMYRFLAGVLAKVAAYLGFESLRTEDVPRVMEEIRVRAGIDADYLAHKFFEKADPPEAGQVPF